VRLGFGGLLYTVRRDNLDRYPPSRAYAAAALPAI
jgi:hypothetical protein